GIVAEEVARCELQVLEVDHGLASLCARVLRAEPLQELLEELAIVGREILESRALGRLARLLERGRARAFAREGGEIHNTLRRRTLAQDAEELVRVSTIRRRCRGVRCQRLCLCA